MKIKRKRKRVILAHIFLILLVVIMLYPIVFSVANSFKTQKEIYGNVLSIIPKNPTLENYVMITSKIPYFKIVCNTFLIATIVMLFKLLTSFVVAYAFVYLKFPFKNVIYFILICTMFIPFSVTMIPNYITISKLNLLDTLWGVLLPQLSDAMGIFMFRQQMRTIPLSLIEVARLEKTPHYKIMGKIVLPIVRPAIISQGIIFFINSWNEYVWPRLILKSEEVYTLSLALQKFVDAEGGIDMSISMAMATATMILPLILFTCCQKQIMSTFASSGIKG